MAGITFGNFRGKGCECSKCEGVVLCAARNLLPDTIKPTHYALLIHPDLDKHTFSGHVEIAVEATAASSVIVLHAHELAIQKASFAAAAGADESPCVVGSFETEEQSVPITLAAPMAAGEKGVLSLDFTGILNDQLAGFYRTKYTSSAGEERYGAVTQFEATDARRAFPCFDEPALKATFDVTLRVRTDRVSLSNMPAIKTVPTSAVDAAGNAHHDVTYATTPKMSTYLLAFAVGEYESVEDVTKGGVTVRVWAPLGEAEQGRFALGVACQVLDFFSSYFDMAFPLPKLDMIAIPDFGAGAMENWGLVTYRTVLLLYKEGSTSLQIKQQIAGVVAHELAHQWFGNLVTMEWWTDLWLNEGFATWVGTRAVAEFFPEWKVWDDFVVRDMGRGLELDSLRSSHPVEVEMKSSSMVNEVFDAISYSKGACSIRMLDAFLTEDVFRDGMRKYVKQFAYSNAVTTDLWACLSEASGGKPVRQMMECWTRQTGYPVVSVAASAGGELQLEQTRFLATGADSSDETTWMVPLRPVGGGLASGAAEVLESKGCVLARGDAPFLKLNAGQSGFYRVSYSEELLDALGGAFAGLSVADRVGVVSDLFALGKAGYGSSTAKPLAFCTKYLKAEASHVVLTEVAAGLGAIGAVWTEAAVTGALDALATEVFGAVALRLGWSPTAGEGDTTALLRALAIRIAATSNHTEVLSQARAKFAAYAAGDASALPPELRSAVFAAVLKHGGEAEYAQLLALYRGTKAMDQRVLLLSALGQSPPALLPQALDFMLSSEVRNQDVIYLLRGVQASGIRLAWQFVRDHWSTFLERYAGGMLLPHVVKVGGRLL